MIGQRLGHYRVLEKIGEGGMGQVYLAEDTKLGRKVALKILPSDLAESEQRRARFDREAKALAALNHPNIITVHSVEHVDGVHFITMELVKGKTLAELIPKRGMQLEKFFPIAIPLADAVAVAHQEGITHRDLKPDNVMVGDDGRIKVLDFGLMKPTRGFVGGDVDSALPTTAKTAEGAIVGTLNYMSPEQAQGKTVDARSDIFSLGILFYEMLTGRRPFSGETPAEILSSIIKDTPDSTSELNPAVPRDLSKLLRRCLAKDPNRRLQSAIDLRNELEETKQEVEAGETSAGVTARQPTPARQWPRWLWFAGGLVGLLAVAFLIWKLPPSDSSTPRFMNPVQVTTAQGEEDQVAWSADGKLLAFTGNSNAGLDHLPAGNTNSDIWILQLGGSSPTNRTADHDGVDVFPAWSPDGLEIAFWSSRDGEGYYIMPALAGPARKIHSQGLAEGNLGVSWSADGTKLACIVESTFVEIINVKTKESRRHPLPGRTTNRLQLSWSPDERFVAYVDGGWREAATELRVLELATGQALLITDGSNGAWSPTWSPDSRIVYYISNRKGTADLWQQRLTDDGGPEGPASQLTTGVGMGRSATFSPDDGKLAYSRGGGVVNLWRVPIHPDRVATWLDAEQLTLESATVESVDLSSDAEKTLLSSDRSGNFDLWGMPSDGGEMVQLTDDLGVDNGARWSPDGDRIVFYSTRSGNRDIWIMPVEGGPARQLTQHPGRDWWPQWSPDGRDIVFSSERSGNFDLWAVSADGGEPRPLTTHPATDRFPSYSDDGALIAFMSNRSGEFLTWLLPLDGGEAFPLTDIPGVRAAWAPDGERIYLMKLGGTIIWSVSLASRSVRQAASLDGRMGSLGISGPSVGREHLYFTWEETLGDIWVMDVVTDK